MGLFDSVLVPCPSCRNTVELQSKAGLCLMQQYPVKEAPPELLYDLLGHEPHLCSQCGARVGMAVIRSEFSPTVLDGGPVSAHDGPYSEVLAALVRAGARYGILHGANFLGMKKELEPTAWYAAEMAVLEVKKLDKKLLDERSRTHQEETKRRRDQITQDHVRMNRLLEKERPQNEMNGTRDQETSE